MAAGECRNLSNDSMTFCVDYIVKYSKKRKAARDEKMNHLKILAEEELRLQKKRLMDSERALSKAPDGYLRSKARAGRVSFYHVHSEERYREENITDNSRKIGQLVRKRINKEIKNSARDNIAVLEQFVDRYRNNEHAEIIANLPKGYKDALPYLGGHPEARNLSAYQRAPFDPKWHVHETVSGFMVRSKSEVIIANTLTSYGIPFNYEEKFDYLGEGYQTIYPDFTIHLPTGKLILWEHLGLLDKEKYAMRTAHRLSVYQQHGYIIYKNLILTEDDNKGNCSSALTDYLVRTQILPFFQ